MSRQGKHGATKGGEALHYGRIAGDLEAVDKVISRLKKTHAKLNFVYEAGPCGYALHRHLTRKGFACSVVAPSMIPKCSGDRIKTDRRDAIMLARQHRADELTAVFVPRAKDEAVRDLTRSREDAVANHRPSRQQPFSHDWRAESSVYLTSSNHIDAEDERRRLLR